MRPTPRRLAPRRGRSQAADVDAVELRRAARAILTSAAACTMASQPGDRRASRLARSVTSPLGELDAGRKALAATAAAHQEAQRVPRRELARRCARPRKPVPPVTRIFMRRSSPPRERPEVGSACSSVALAAAQPEAAQRAWRRRRAAGCRPGAGAPAPLRTLGRDARDASRRSSASRDRHGRAARQVVDRRRARRSRPAGASAATPSSTCTKSRRASRGCRPRSTGVRRRRARWRRAARAKEGSAKFGDCPEPIRLNERDDHRAPRRSAMRSAAALVSA